MWILVYDFVCFHVDEEVKLEHTADHIFKGVPVEGNIQTYDLLFFPLFQQSTFFCARVLFERENLGKQVIWSACGTIHENQQLWQIYVQGCDQKINFTCLGLPELYTPWANKDLLKYRK